MMRMLADQGRDLRIVARVQHADTAWDVLDLQSNPVSVREQLAEYLPNGRSPQWVENGDSANVCNGWKTATMLNRARRSTIPRPTYAPIVFRGRRRLCDVWHTVLPSVTGREFDQPLGRCFGEQCLEGAIEVSDYE